MIGVLQMEKQLFNIRQIFKRLLGNAALAAIALGQMFWRVCAAYIFMKELSLGTSQCEREAKPTKSGRLSHLPFRTGALKPFKNVNRKNDLLCFIVLLSSS